MGSRPAWRARSSARRTNSRFSGVRLPPLFLSASVVAAVSANPSKRFRSSMRLSRSSSVIVFMIAVAPSLVPT